MSIDLMEKQAFGTLAANGSGQDLPHYREAPHNLEAEQGVLGAMLVDNRAIEKVCDILKPEHFYAPVHRRIYEAVLTLTNRSQAVSPVTLKTYFENDADLAHVGGPRYLAELAASVLTVVDAADYARMLYELYLRRELIALGEDIVNDAHDRSPEAEASETIEQAETRLFTLAETGTSQRGFITLRDSVMTAIEIAEKAYHADSHVTGVTTGLADLDRMLGGLHDSDLLILAARPSMGKTALATNIAFSAANAYAKSGGKEGAIVAFFSLEMSHDQLTTRVLADQASISGDAIRKGTITEKDFHAFAHAAHALSQVPLYIDDTPALSISAIRTRARRLKRQFGLGMIVVDYLQLLRGSGSRQSETSRVVEISEITRGLKAVAKELNVPVVALSQLSRAVEQREDKRPLLSDLRESGAIEQDADVVMFIFREEYYLARSMPDIEDHEKYGKWQEKMDRALNVAEVIIAKQRHGPIGTVRLFFDPNYTRFADLEQVVA